MSVAAFDLARDFGGLRVDFSPYFRNDLIPIHGRDGKATAIDSPDAPEKGAVCHILCGAFHTGTGGGGDTDSLLTEHS